MAMVMMMSMKIIIFCDAVPCPRSMVLYPEAVNLMVVNGENNSSYEIESEGTEENMDNCW
jgi:hypothetical protein